MAQERPWAEGHFYINTLVRLGRSRFCPRLLTRGLPLSRVRNPVSRPPPAAMQRPCQSGSSGRGRKALRESTWDSEGHGHGLRVTGCCRHSSLPAEMMGK